MYKIAVFGDRDSIYGYAALGLDIYPVEDLEEAEKTFKDIVQGNVYAVVYMTENWYTKLTEEVAKAEEMVTPAVIPIPGAHGNTGIGIANVKKMVEKAVGSDIIFGNEN